MEQTASCSNKPSLLYFHTEVFSDNQIPHHYDYKLRGDVDYATSEASLLCQRCVLYLVTLHYNHLIHHCPVQNINIIRYKYY